jgi:HlyD family secretion protein
MPEGTTPAGQPNPALPLPTPHATAASPGGTARLWAWLLVLALALGAGAAAWRLMGAEPGPVADAQRMPAGTVVTRTIHGQVVALGKLLPRSRILIIAPPFGAGDARIATLPVQEGETVPASAVLARMDSEPALRAALASAEATHAARVAALEQTRIAIAAALEESRSGLARAEAALPILRRDMERAASLVGRGAATEQVADQRRLAYEQAVQEVLRARANLTRYAAPSLDEQADVVLARRNAEAAAADRDRALADLDKAVIRAPMAGTVLTLYARPGERPAAQGLMSFGGLDQMIAEIEVYEDQVNLLAPGQPVTLSAAALPRALNGSLGRIGAEVLRQTLTDASPAANTDTRVLRAVIELDAASAAIAARFANLQVTARIRLAPPGAPQGGGQGAE